MEDIKIRQFMQLAGQKTGTPIEKADENLRKLGAQLLLSETLEYVIKGLGVTPEFNGIKITDANGLNYLCDGKPADKLEMLDGLSDVAYTMYWNSVAFAMRLDEAFDLVCNNNLEKFVFLKDWNGPQRPLERSEWDCGSNISWPAEVVEVQVVQVEKNYYAVGKDKNGKVRKPSSYKAVDLSALVKASA